MKRRGSKAVTDTKWFAASLFAMLLLACIGTPRARAQSNEPVRINTDIPYEARVPWFNPEHTEVEDEVLLQGTMHLNSRVWWSSPTHVERIVVHLNVVDVHGTSETTGQRFRLNGSYSLDQRDPEGTLGPDGLFIMTLEEVGFFLHKVDPEPARLDGWITTRTSIGASYTPSGPVPCAPIFRADGTPTGFFNCGNFIYGTYVPPELYGLQVRANSGAACAAPGCDVPDGAVLFNGYAGDYNPPLIMAVRAWPETNVSVRFHCKTGNLEAPASSFVVTGGGVGTCRPFYSATEPITVYADITKFVPDYYGNNLSLRFSSDVRTYRMLERPVDHPPVIESGSFSVMAWFDPEHVSEVPGGAILFNGQTGDYVPPLFLRLNASDPEGDPISIQWYCMTGTSPAPIFNVGNGVYSCEPLYSPTDPITVYAVVSDGTNNVTSDVRTYTMLERIN